MFRHTHEAVPALFEFVHPLLIRPEPVKTVLRFMPSRLVLAVKREFQFFSLCYGLQPRVDLLEIPAWNEREHRRASLLHSLALRTKLLREPPPHLRLERAPPRFAVGHWKACE